MKLYPSQFALIDILKSIILMLAVHGIECAGKDYRDGAVVPFE